MCRAQGIPHLKVSGAAELRTALRSAWALNRHSVVEVVTDRASNVSRHRTIQAAAQAAMARALPLLRPALRRQREAAAAAAVPEAAEGAPAPAPAPFALRIAAAAYEPISLPLARPHTTPAGAAHSRHGFVLRLGLAGPGAPAPATEHPNGAAPSNGAAAAANSGPVPQTPLAWGAGEVAPLPGLSAETAQQAEQQLAMLCELLEGCEVPLTLALLGGRLSEWLEQGLGVGAGALHPSVRAGLEAALLSALAQVSPAAAAGEGGTAS